MLNKRLKQYLAAEEAILNGGQSYTIGNRTLTRANLGEIRKQITALLQAGATVDDEAPQKGRRRAQIVLGE